MPVVYTTLVGLSSPSEQKHCRDLFVVKPVSPALQGDHSVPMHTSFAKVLVAPLPDVIKCCLVESDQRQAGAESVQAIHLCKRCTFTRSVRHDHLNRNTVASRSSSNSIHRSCISVSSHRAPHSLKSFLRVSGSPNSYALRKFDHQVACVKGASWPSSNQIALSLTAIVMQTSLPIVHLQTQPPCWSSCDNTPNRVLDERQVLHCTRTLIRHSLLTS